jgi:cell division protein FtsB
MLSTKERQIVFILKRRLLYLFIAFLFTLYWVRTKYLDNEYLYYQIESSQYEIMELEDENSRLQLKIDSILENRNKPKVTKKESKIIINKKQEELKKDSTLPKIIEYTPEGGSEMLDEPLSDTLKR